MADFPNQVNVVQAPALEGDFASTNPRGSALTGQGGFIAGPAGVTIGRFAWAAPSPMDNDNAPNVVSNTYPGIGPSIPMGFAHREQQGLITAYLAASGMVIAPGFNMALMTFGDFWVKNANAAAAAQIGNKAYANLSNGTVSFAATGTPTTNTGGTSSTTTQSTFSVTGSITGNIMTITAVSSGTIVVGSVISGTGVTTGNQVVSQISGTTGGVGVYYVNYGEQTVASTTISGTYSVITIAGGAPAGFAVGVLLTGATIGGTGAYITALGTGAGGAGTYYSNYTGASLTSQTIGNQVNVETKYIAMSSGLAGELVKISSATTA